MKKKEEADTEIIMFSEVIMIMIAASTKSILLKMSETNFQKGSDTNHMT